MSNKTTISWTNRTWNVLTGCTPVSEGCRFCYAARLAATRLRHLPQYAGTTKRASDGRAVFNGTVNWSKNPADYLEPLGVKVPALWFVNSMSDFHHESVPDHVRDQMVATMLSADWHTFQVLTKRDAAMRDYWNDPNLRRRLELVMLDWDHHGTAQRAMVRAYGRTWPDHVQGILDSWPPPNIWVGVSVESPSEVYRLESLARTNVAVRFCSAEPLVADWSDALPLFEGRLEWLILGGESGTPRDKPRFLHFQTARNFRDQCRRARIPFHFKQWGDFVPCSNLSTDPEDTDYRSMAMPPDVTEETYEQYLFAGSQVIKDRQAIGFGHVRVGVGKAGNWLDGQQHLAYPEEPDL